MAQHVLIPYVAVVAIMTRYMTSQRRTLMNLTKHDLSYDETKLDYQALVRTADIAFVHTRNEIERLLHRTHDIPTEGQPVINSHVCGRINDLAEQLAVSAETAHTLHEGLTRHRLKVINKPKVKEE